MIDCEAVRQIALSLPEVIELDHRGRPSFRVRKKTFATLWELERRAVVKIALEDQAMLVATKPKVFLTGPASHQGWTGVELAKVDKSLFCELLIDSWRRLAPKGLVLSFDAKKAETARRSKASHP
jgi:hypothetical protein